MNNSHIMLLPIEILRRIPTSYRMWKLLQMASSALSSRLGDYHNARGIQMFIGKSNSSIPYSAFVTVLVASMMNTVDCKSLLMTHTNGKALGEYILKWNGCTMYINRHSIITCLIATSNINSECIFIRDQMYITQQYMSRSNMNRLFIWIHNELPGLFYVMRSLQPLQIRDTNT